MSDKMDELTHSLKRVERLLGGEKTKHTVQRVLSQEQNTIDRDIIMESAQGYGTASPEEVNEAMERMEYRGIVFDADVVATAQEMGKTAEEVAERVIERGLEKHRGSRKAKTREYTADMLGVELKESGGKDSFFDPARTARPSSEQSARAKAAAKAGRGTDADMDKVLGALMGFDD